MSTGTDTWEWECPTCKYLEASQGDNEAQWDFGICGRCNNIVPEDVTCVTCLLNQGNKNTYAALTHIMKMYRDEPTILHPKEFVILASYYHYLHEQCQEVDTWNRLTWLEYYENPYAVIQGDPVKMVPGSSQISTAMGLKVTGRMSRNYALTVYRFHWLVLSGWLITMHPRCSAMCLWSRVLQRLQMVNG